MIIWQYLLFAIIIIGLFFLVVMIIDCHRLIIREYNFKSDKVTKDTDFVLLSDLHSKSFGKNNIRLIEKIDSIKPDAIIISGDMYTAMKGDSGKVAINLLKELASRYRIYYANGNHEQKTRLSKDEFGNVYEDYFDIVEKLGVKHLVNESFLDVDSNINIYGLEVDFKYYRKFKRYTIDVEELNELIGEAPKETYNILIAHNPQYFDSYALWNADLVLSGHVHGGLMRFPGSYGFLSPNYTFFPKYSGGEYKKYSSSMVLSCGIGTHHLPIRIFNPGEISHISIKSDKN